MRRYTFAVIAVLLVLVPGRQALRADAAHYTIENLGDIGGLLPTITGMNASGQISGYVNGPAGSVRAVRYSDGHGWEYLPGLDSYSVATGINTSGDLVGYQVTPAGSYAAFRYTDSGGVQAIDPMPNGSMLLGFGINDHGDVVGYGDSDGFIVGFIARSGEPTVKLPSLGGVFALACGINNAGQVAGVSLTADNSQQHAMRIDPDLPAPVEIYGLNGAASNSYGCAIDADGRVGGYADGGVAQRAFRFQGTTSGSPTNIDTFASAGSSTEAIAAGISVGWFSGAENSPRAFVHTDADGMNDLNTLLDSPAGWVLTMAKGVNADGVIVGEGTFNGAPALFRLKKVAAAPADTTPPVFTSLTASPSTIWPPKGQTVTVTVTATATDDSGQAPVCTLSSISGPGSSPTDYNVTGPNTGTVLAIGGRTYTFNETCVDGSNNSASSSVAVTVPADTTAPAISAVSANPSTIWPPTGNLVPVLVTVSATDDVDTAPVCALSSITSTATTADDSSITGTFTARLRAVGGRTYTLYVRCSDAAGNASTASTSVVVPPDTTAPVITSVGATPSSLWPPNGKFVPVSVSVNATDDVDESPSCSLTSITGAPSTDYLITGAFTASVRSEKNSDGSVRIYVLHVTCSDQSHNTSTAGVAVTITKTPAQSAKPSNR